MAGEAGEKLTAVIVAGGSGKRMGAGIPKQYLELRGVPILVHTLRAFAAWKRLDEIVLVTAEEEMEFCRAEIIGRYGIPKVKAVVPGGRTRSASVYSGLLACPDADYVFIQDAVRPFLTEELLERGYETVRRFGSAVCGMPAKDTVKIVSEEGVVRDTPARENVWIVQTPQIFSGPLIRSAYQALIEAEGEAFSENAGITDDAMVLEKSGLAPVHMFRGDYANIKITTPDDMLTGEAILEKSEKQKPPKCL